MAAYAALRRRLRGARSGLAKRAAVVAAAGRRRATLRAARGGSAEPAAGRFLTWEGGIVEPKRLRKEARG